MNIFGVIGWKDSGKTGLMERLVSEMTNRGFKISTLNMRTILSILIIKAEIVLDTVKLEHQRLCCHPIIDGH